ncbi:MAG: PrsW family intramembrane metalloprotease [Anaerolineales bacterium]|nr:PrsW family intramembrane metalloprotease [Anaerolineales bacterium]
MHLHLIQSFLGLVFSLFFGFAPVFLFAWFIYWLDRYEKEPKILLWAVFTWGTVVAAGAAFLINSLLGMGMYLFTNSEAAAEMATGALVAPVVEELLKGFAVLVIFLTFRHEFDTLMDGVVYAAIVGLGFAASENTFYIYTHGYQENGFGGLFWLVFVRVVLVGWQHPFYTAFTGIGLAASRLSRDVQVKLVAASAGLLAAIAAHAVHNTIGRALWGAGMAIGMLFDWSGWLIMFLFILWAVRREQRWIVAHLREEVSLGLITQTQYRTACSAWAQSAARLGALFSGHYQDTHRFYHLCAKLAYKKQHHSALGEEDGNSRMIEGLRAELKRLSSEVRY